MGWAFPWSWRAAPAAPVRCAEAKVLASDLDLEAAAADPAYAQVLPPAVMTPLREAFFAADAGEQIAGAVELRKRLAQTYDRDRLKFLVAHLRDRRRVVLGAAAGAAYAAAAPDLDDPKVDGREMLGEAESLLEQLKLA